MNVLVLSEFFGCLCNGYTANINICTLTVRGSTLDVRILTTKVGPRAVRIHIFKLAVYPSSSFLWSAKC